MNFLILLTSLLMGTLTYAGDKGNGGGIHLCSDGRAQMYDLYEGFTRYNIVAQVDNSMSMNDYIDRALKKIDHAHPAVGFKVREVMKYLIEDKRLLLRSNLNLKLIEDANILVVDVNCSYEQLANWDELSGNVIVKEEYFNKLDNLNKAALYVHEALYKVARDYYYERDSDDVRKSVAEAFGAQPVFSHFDRWTSRAKEIKVLDSDLGLSVTTIQEREFNNVELKIHLGNHNLYDSSKKIKFILIQDYSAARIRTEEINNVLVNLEKEKKVLESRIEKVQNSFTKKKEYRKLRDKIQLIDNDLHNLNFEKDKISVYAKAGIIEDNILEKDPRLPQMLFGTPDNKAGLIVKFTFKVIIDDETYAISEFSIIPPRASSPQVIKYDVSQNRTMEIL